MLILLIERRLLRRACPTGIFFRRGAYFFDDDQIAFILAARQRDMLDFAQLAA